jgi:GDP-D-mannose 3',5'-epimerase
LFGVPTQLWAGEHIAGYHNVVDPKGVWDGGKEKTPAAICRKVAQTQSGDAVDIWGDGE